MTGKGLICKLGEHIPIEGADRIVQVDMFGETIITQKTNEEGTVGILFDCETQLSKEYAGANDMFRNPSMNKNQDVTGYLEQNARVRPIKLKGVKCSGLFMPLNTLYNMDVKVPNLDIGQEIDVIDGVKICEKYIPKATQNAMKKNKQGRSKKDLAPTFKEHFDTDQWGRNMNLVKEGNLITITEKLHGTSGRCGYLPTVQEKKWWQKLFRLDVPNKYNFVVGSRRVVKSIGGVEAEDKNHYYDEDLWTKISREYFEGKLHKGETVYFEIVGYTPSGEAIMGRHSNSKLKNFMTKAEYKDFIAKYGEETVFTYGTDTYEVYVYRITSTNEDGETIDYSWDQVKTRCEQMAVEHVPEIEQFIATPYTKGSDDARDSFIADHYGTPIKDLVANHTESESKEFPQHLKEGICIRIDNGGLTPIILKSKAFLFKALEGIIKEADVVDIEEAN